MSLSGSYTESYSESSYDEFSEFEDEFEETQSKAPRRDSASEKDDVDEGAYQDEPIASREWVEDYKERQEQIAELEKELRKRLSNELPVSDWCKCGNCETRNLQNISECYCCAELDGCVESLTSDLVRQEVPADVQLTCVIEHPGFQPVCLQQWSLRMAADRLKTKSKQRYRQTGSEERFMRSIAYREFTRLIYGMIGAKRIPLPACAYTAIRNTFPLSDSEATFTGFDLDEDES